MKKNWTEANLVELNIEATANEVYQVNACDDWTTDSMGNPIPVTNGQTGWNFANEGSGEGEEETYTNFPGQN